MFIPKCIVANLLSNLISPEVWLRVINMLSHSVEESLASISLWTNVADPSDEGWEGVDVAETS